MLIGACDRISDLAHWDTLSAMQIAERLLAWSYIEAFMRTNILTAAAVVIYVAVALVALVHRAAWPAVERPLYAVARHGLVRRRRTVSAVGVMLLGVATEKVGTVLLDLFKRLGFW
jgi:hypothetical protein